MPFSLQLAETMRIGVYPGSFDPLTNGHLDLVQRASRLADVLIVAVLVNSEKTPLLPVDTRVDLVKQACSAIPGVRVDSFSGLVVDYARNLGAHFIVRGLRNLSDFDFEFSMARVNSRMHPDLETILLPASEGTQAISSRLVKEIYALGGDVSQFVPLSIAQYLQSTRESGNGGL